MSSSVFDAALMSRLARPPSKGAASTAACSLHRPVSAQQRRSSAGATCRPLARRVTPARPSSGRLARPPALTALEAVTSNTPRTTGYRGSSSSRSSHLRDSGGGERTAAAQPPLQPEEQVWGSTSRGGPSSTGDTVSCKLSEMHGNKSARAVPSPPAASEEPPQSSGPVGVPTPGDVSGSQGDVREQVAAFIRSTVAKQKSVRGSTSAMPEIRQYRSTARSPALPRAPAVVTSGADPPAGATGEQQQQQQQQPSSAAVAPTKLSLQTATAGASAEAPQSLTDAEDAALRGLHGCGTRNCGEYVYHFPGHGHYCCRRCRTPLFAASSKANVPGGFAVFSKVFAHSLVSRIQLPDEGSLNALLVLGADVRPATIVCSCVRCGGFIGESAHAAGGNAHVKVNSSCIAYVSADAPPGFAGTEQELAGDGDDGGPELDGRGFLISAAERAARQERRISSWGKAPAYKGPTNGASERPTYRGPVRRGTLLMQRRDEDSSNSSLECSGSDMD